MQVQWCISVQHQSTLIRLMRARQLQGPSMLLTPQTSMLCTRYHLCYVCLHTNEHQHSWHWLPTLLSLPQTFQHDRHNFWHDHLQYPPTFLEHQQRQWHFHTSITRSVPCVYQMILPVVAVYAGQQ